MKILAALANCGWLVFVVITFVKEPPSGSDVWLLILLIFATVFLNLAGLFWRGGTHNWLSLFLQRKALEEKKKMETLLREGQ